jgi:hypothetical protein
MCFRVFGCLVVAKKEATNWQEMPINWSVMKMEMTRNTQWVDI